MDKYIFYIPEYNNISNGICLLWEAAYQFSKLKEVIVIPYSYGYKTELPEKFLKLNINKNKEINGDEIIIYPEGVKGNPLNGKKVCRYLMAKPYILNGEGVDYKEEDFLFAYSNATQKLVPQYNIFNDNFKTTKKWSGCEKKVGKVTIYYGKCRIGVKYENIINVLKSASEVYVATRKLPTNKNELYNEIATSELFISLDPLTSLMYESTLLGTPVLVADPVFKDLYDQYNHKLYGFYYGYQEYQATRINNLAELTYQDYLVQLSLNNEKTLNIIKEIEDYFYNKKNKVPVNEIIKEDIRFYVEEWNLTPILNVTILKSILLFHALNRKTIFFSILLTLHMNWNKLKNKLTFINYFKSYFNKICINFFHPLTYEILLLERKRSRLKNILINLEKPTKNDTKSVGIMLSQRALLLLWRI